MAVAFGIEDREVPSVVKVSKVQFSPFRVLKVANNHSCRVCNNTHNLTNICINAIKIIVCYTI